MFILTVAVWTEYVLVHFSLSPAVVKVLPSFLVSFIQSQTAVSGEKKATWTRLKTGAQLGYV